jgi:hypothetical protein
MNLNSVWHRVLFSAFSSVTSCDCHCYVLHYFHLEAAVTSHGIGSTLAPGHCIITRILWRPMMLGACPGCLKCCLKNHDFGPHMPKILYIPHNTVKCKIETIVLFNCC